MKLALAILILAMPLYAATPCCGVTAIGRDGVITAKDVKTGRIFQFSVKPEVMLGMKVGQDVYANFDTKKVSVDGVTPCCNIFNLDAVDAKGNLKLGVSDVVSIDAGTHIATARDKATGRTFQFKIEGAAIKLKAGDIIFANFAVGKVSVDQLGPCCSIIH